ncbi:hypothetical protein TNCV_334571 [Trichonephila clavipes]|nr:hypothetical protein TNCV_334571 [Trichonephila clavipes]
MLSQDTTFVLDENHALYKSVSEICALDLRQDNRSRFGNSCDNALNRDTMFKKLYVRNFKNANQSSRIVTGGKVRAANRLPRKFHTCSMGLRSGDRAGQSIRSKSSYLAATVR